MNRRTPTLAPQTLAPPPAAAVAAPAVWVYILLALLPVAVYWPVTSHEFINFDDDQYVVDNFIVRRGLTPPGVAWAFASFYASNWHPLTWLSHMLDVTLFGLRPWGHHLTSLLLHTANTMLLFAFWWRLTGALWRSALVAALFALHPLHVESVAWVAERKDILSTCFAFLSLLFYARYAQHKMALDPRPSALNYLLALSFFACGLLSKPMLVTLPCVMLMLDYWPLERLRSSTIQRLAFEKTPFLTLSAVSSAVTFLAQQKHESVVSVASLPLLGRLNNVFVSYLRYLGKTFWPVDLAVFYPAVYHWAGWLVAASLLLLLLVSMLALALARQWPYLPVGWFWFLGMLIPVIGLIQVGGQSMADRYTYLPLVGIFVLCVWGGSDVLSRWRWSRLCSGVLAAAMVTACAARTMDQLRYWRDSEALFRHALAVAGSNPVAELNLGTYLFKQGRSTEAMAHLRKAIEDWPESAAAWDAMGLALALRGQLAEAITYYRKALELKPNLHQARNNLGIALIAAGQFSEAIACFQTILRDQPDNPEIHFNLGLAYSRAGRWADAIQEFRWVLRNAPEVTGVHQQLGSALLAKGEPAEAVDQLRAALRSNPDSPDVLNTLAWALATSLDSRVRDGAEAVRLGERAARATHLQNPGALDTLAAAYAESGRWAEAVATAQKALDQAMTAGKKELAAEIHRRMELYRAGKPYRE